MRGRSHSRVAAAAIPVIGALFTGATCVPSSTAPLNSAPGTTTAIVIIRHAERDPGEFVPLNDEGFQRREALKSALEEQGVTAIYCTDTLRNRQTVEPLAELLGLSVQLVNPLRLIDPEPLADELVNEMLANHAGGTVLFCGNVGSSFGTMGINEAIYRRLGGSGRPPGRYQDMYIAVVPDEGATRFIKTEYGGPSSLD